MSLPITTHDSPPLPDLLTVAMVAHLFSCSPDTVRGLVSVGRLRAVNISPTDHPNGLRITRASVEGITRGSWCFATVAA